MELYFLRHGKAADPTDGSYASDAARPLTKEGIAEMKAQAKALKEIGLKVDVIWTSPLVRARQTAEIVAAELRPQGELVETELLRPPVNLAKLEALIASVAEAEAVMFVGHEPDYSMLVGELIASAGANVEMKKGGLALVEVHPPLRAGRGVLRWLLSPKVLR